MPELMLTGIPGDSPIGAMAALGVFRVASIVQGAGNVKFAWSKAEPFCPLLVTPEPLTAGALIAMLAQHIEGAVERYELTWADRAKALSAADFRAHAAKTLDLGTDGGYYAANWIVAFGAEAAQGRDEEFVPTPFDTSFAQQTFPGDFRQLAKNLHEDPLALTDSLREAIFGPWMYRDDQHSMGWDPTTVRVHAHSPQAPSKSKAQGVRAAVWLAFESLPLFPCFPRGRGVQPRGFSCRERQLELCWPIWSVPVAMGALKSLLGLELVTCARPNVAEMRARGIHAVFASRRTRSSKYAVFFEAARVKARLRAEIHAE